MLSYRNWIVTAFAGKTWTSINFEVWVFFVFGVQMKVTKILNNNAVVVLDDNMHEQIVMGRGVAFQKRMGDSIDEDKIDKTFTLHDPKVLGKFSEILKEIPLEVMAVCDRIINIARQRLGTLNENLYITLTDHCYFAIERYNSGILIKNVLLWEIKRLYPKEFEIGQDACKIISDRLNVDLPEDEAGFIALHLVTGQLHNEISDVMNITHLMQEVLQIIKHQLRIEYHEDSLSYHRLITHLKFFIHRIISGTEVEDDDPALQLAVKNNYSLAWNCAEKVANHLQSSYQQTPTNEEIMFLAIHIERVRKDVK